MTSVFKGGIAGNADRGGWNSSKFTGGITDRAGPPSVFPVTFVFYLNNLRSEALLSTSSILSL